MPESLLRGKLVDSLGIQLNNKRATKKQSRLINAMMLVAMNVSFDAVARYCRPGTYLNVPTPPASNKNVGPFSNA